MNKIFCLIFLSFLAASQSFAQFEDDSPIIPKINEIKQSIVLINAEDDTSTKYTFAGTGVLVGYSDITDLFVLTCEHIIAIKEPPGNGKTVRYYNKLKAFLHTKDKKVISLPLELLYANEAEDFALLALRIPPGYNDFIKKVIVKRIPYSQFSKVSELKEGQTVLYMGYPGLYYNPSTSIWQNAERTNYYPLARTGIISQIIPEDSRILIDGFAQSGYSGSPVFSIASHDSLSFDKGKLYLFKSTEYKLIGITKAFPKEFGEINKIESRKYDSLETVLNPGFTMLTPMDNIIKLFENKKLFLPKEKN